MKTQGPPHRFAWVGSLLERFVGSYRAKIRDIRDVNYIEHIKIK